MLEESKRLFTCGFCRVKSYLLQPSHFRYALPAGAPQDRRLYYFPYWRFKGLAFTCTMQGVQHRFVDISNQALPSGLIPLSLGFRSQTLKLRFAAPGLKGRFLRPRTDYEAVLKNHEERLGREQKGNSFHKAYIGETISLIYAPFYIEEGVMQDGVLNRPVGAPLPDDFDPEDFAADEPDWPVRFIPNLCPRCGWDLEGGEESLALNCRNCDSIWYTGEKGLKEIACGVMLHPEASASYVYFPFWRIKADVSGIPLNSCADLAKIANLPRAAQKCREESSFYFWTAAFKIRPQLFVRLASLITLSQPQGETGAGMPKNAGLHPVTMPPAEAVESLKVTLADFMTPRGHYLPKLPDVSILAREIRLTYLPFIDESHEFIHPVYPVAINKKALSFSGDL